MARRRPRPAAAPACCGATNISANTSRVTLHTFLPQVGGLDLHLFAEGRHRHAQLPRRSRAHRGQVSGVLFAVWAPNARARQRRRRFQRLGRTTPRCAFAEGSGIWELFIPDLEPGHLYKYEIRNRDSGEIVLKADPYGQHYELRPRTGSIIPARASYAWGDGEWMAQRAHHDWQHRPMSVSQAHLGSWQRDAEGGFLGYREAAHRLVEYVKDMGFLIELLPITEHPTTPPGATRSPAISRRPAVSAIRMISFVDHCHRNGIGVLLDWCPRISQGRARTGTFRRHGAV